MLSQSYKLGLCNGESILGDKSALFYPAMTGIADASGPSELNAHRAEAAAFQLRFFLASYVSISHTSFTHLVGVLRQVSTSLQLLRNIS